MFGWLLAWSERRDRSRLRKLAKREHQRACDRQDSETAAYWLDVIDNMNMHRC